MAVRLREETLVTAEWIAARAGMGTASYVNHRLYRWRKGTLARRDVQNGPSSVSIRLTSAFLPDFIATA